MMEVDRPKWLEFGTNVLEQSRAVPRKTKLVAKHSADLACLRAGTSIALALHVSAIGTIQPIRRC